MTPDQSKLLDAVVRIAKLAGEEILEVYRRDGRIVAQSKSDDSPLTEADTRANNVIVRELQSLAPAIPVLSEESAVLSWDVRSQWPEYWLIDPLDGTKEFINRNDEFTVNIALVRGGEPVLGVVHAPVLARTWSGVRGAGAWRQEGADVPQEIRCTKMPAEIEAATVVVVASRRHGAEALQGILDTLKTKFKDVELVNMGSSLKICIIAEGGADFYPRLAPTSEWDTAAAQAVLCAAGGMIYQLDFTPLCYNSKEDLLNPSFIAVGDMEFGWRDTLGLTRVPADSAPQ
ncbi:MAG: 3'(2'),5'-bisphosphate nucleotidase CysQ [Gammaproteobacteria bacterium]|nr:3'(2'),5'-bisphosphate nucleotidase CysQ [Gammaproteobacteria bacterium]MDP2139961.1 3'(2'),5'-bisphosphate nucleotidase CysQ [Gammaproteobacteria bacterium]MDP2347781.1 3'(2'),5'-bisphosphate nucleotidase CysQ [Gammaproteobacteria bacterium]